MKYKIMCVNLWRIPLAEALDMGQSGWDKHRLAFTDASSGVLKSRKFLPGKKRVTVDVLWICR